MNCQNCYRSFIELLGLGFDELLQNCLGLGLCFDDNLGLGYDFMALLFSLGFDHQFLYVDMSQNHNQVQFNKKEGDEKKKAKSPVTWHEIECNGSVKKGDSKVSVYYNQSRLKRSGRTCCFGPQPKAGAQGLLRKTRLICVTREMIECNWF